MKIKIYKLIDLYKYKKPYRQILEKGTLLNIN